MPTFPARLAMPRRTRCTRVPRIALAVFVMLASLESQLLPQADGKEREIGLAWKSMLGAGADSMKSLSPSILKWRLSVPFHSSFQETSTTVMRSLLSIGTFLNSFDKARRIALTRIELGNTVGGHWHLLRAQALYSRLRNRQNAVSPHHPRTCE